MVDAWDYVGKEGFKICRFKLVYSGDNEFRGSAEEIELNPRSRSAKMRVAEKI